MLRSKDSESDGVTTNTVRVQESCRSKKGDKGHEESSGCILKNALLSIQSDEEDFLDKEASKVLLLQKGSDVDGESATSSWNNVNTDSSVSYVTSIPNGKEFVILTGLEQVNDKAVTTTKGLKLYDSLIPFEKNSKIQHSSKQHNKIILLGEFVSEQEAIIGIKNGEQTETTKEVKETMEQINYSSKTFDSSQFEKNEADLKEGNNWLKSFRPLPLYYTERGKPYLKCPACGAMFFTSTSFQKHLFTHMYKERETYTCSFCEYTNAEPGMLFAHLSKHQDQCEYCNENIMRKSNFEKHWGICSLSFSIKRDRRGRFCKECGGLYGNKTILQNHKCLKCPVCGEVYDSLHRLKAHTMWMKHHLKCLICSYEFVLAMDHEKHLAMHRQAYLPMKEHAHCLEAADGKSYQCDLCDKIFYALTRLILHVKEDHGIEDVKREAIKEEKDEKQHNEASNRLQVGTTVWTNTLAVNRY
ncbi:hypothetical protein M0802_008366 [Mischocyttarus mexicanus]|nr:hypothetical protein M0802_008366 [Mischocyttarus mexicanus]